MRTKIAILVMAAGIAGSQTSTPATTNAPTACSTCKGIPVRKCNVCGGHGVATCPTCRGVKFGPEKTVQKPCLSCGGRARWRVDNMVKIGGGAGQRVDKIAFGSREVTCPQCKGVGTFEAREQTYCTTCNGTGHATCSRCQGTRSITCPTCKGKGTAR